MRPRCMIPFLILSLITYFRLQITKGEEHRFQDSLGEKKNRRILHQPLFPASSAPPPQSELSPPPPPDRPESPDQDQPFFHELPNGSTPDQVQQSPQAPASGTTVRNPVVTQPSKPAKKVAIAISVGIVTLGMFSALAFYLYKHRVKHPDVSQKLVSGNSQTINEDSGVGPSTFLYVGTVEPSITRSVSETNVVNISPSQNLKSIERSDQKRYRPSPDLQPLPPLNKPPPPPSINLSPPVSSSDDESHDTTFYSAHASSVSNMSPSSRHSNPSNNSSLMHQARPDHVVPQLKRTSPKSLLSMSSPDTKHTIIPTTNQLLPPYPFPPPPPPPPPPPASSLESLKQSEGKPSISAQPYIPKRPKFSAPPPPLDIGRLQWINNDVQQASKIPVPPPPPMPTSRKLSTIKNTPSTASTLIRSQSRSPSPRATPRIKKTSPVEEVNTGVSSSEKQDAEDSEGSKPRLKPFHWDKVRTTSDRATVWDQLNSSSFQLNEDAMESLFGWSSANSVPKEATRKSVLPPLEMENRVLDPKKSQNIAILLRALNVTRDEVSEALLDGNPEGLGADLLETLVKMTPTKEEEIKLKDYNGDISKLGTAERFLKAVLDIPFAFKRVEAMLYRANFDTEVKYLRKSFLTIEEASEELKNSRLFLKLLEAVLRTGNRMNVGTNRGDARAFKLDTLLKLVDIKGTDGKTTLLHFVVQEILRSEGADSDPTNQSMSDKTNFSFKEEDFKRQGLQVVAGLSKELGNVRKAAGMDSDLLSSYVSKLEIGLEKVGLVLLNEKQNSQGNFFKSMQMFLDYAQMEINGVKAEERATLSLVKELTEYFHGDAVREEAHPFRIFMIVRDFLSTLDSVCKDVGTLQDRTTIGSARSFRIPVTASLPVLNRYNIQHDRSSDDESMSS